MIASLGISEVAVYRRLRVAFFSTGDELRSIGTPLAAGEIYDSNRYTLYGMLHAPRLRSRSTWASCPTSPRRSSARSPTPRRARRRRDHVRRRVGRRGRLREAAPRQAGRGAVLEDRDEAGPSARLRPDRQRAFLRPARQSGLGDGDVLPVRARRAARPAGPARRRAAADVQGDARRADPQGARPHRVPARHPDAATATAAGPCARPATRARASCRRCRRRTASSSCRPTPATSRPASSSTCSCSRG